MNHNHASQSQDRNACSITEACYRLSISRPTVYRLAKDGKIKLVKIGGRTLVPMAEIIRLVNGEAA